MNHLVLILRLFGRCGRVISMSVIIRFGYCPPNPGPKKKLKNKWYSNPSDAIAAYNGEELWIRENSQVYIKITYEDLIKLI